MSSDWTKPLAGSYATTKEIKMKTVFTSHGHDACSIKYLNKEFDLIERRTFIRKGHYVFEIIGLSSLIARQLCRNLSTSGITLMTDPSIDLIDIIRKEYRKFQAEQLKTLCE